MVILTESLQQLSKQPKKLFLKNLAALKIRRAVEQFTALFISF